MFLSLNIGVCSAGAAYRFVTFSGHSRVGSADGNALTARLFAPTNVALDRDGNLYVSDSGNHTIRKVQPSGGITTTVAGSAGLRGSADGAGSDARFSHPEGIAIDAAGNLVVADRDNHTIRRITPAGQVSTLAGSPGQAGFANGPAASARFNYPRGVAIDSLGTIYVCDASATVRAISPAGVVRTVAGQANAPGTTDGPAGVAQLSNPIALTVDPAGRIYVAEEGRNSVRRILLDGSVETLGGINPVPGNAWGSSVFMSPRGLAAAADGTIYVADSNHTIRKILPNGTDSTLAGQALLPGFANGPGTQAQFDRPAGLAVSLDGNVYVADEGNHAIRVISPAAQVRAVIPSLTFPPMRRLDSDVASDALFVQPQGLAFAPDGSLYITDVSALRRISASGRVSTFARTPDVLAGNVAHPLDRMFRVAVNSAGEIFVLGGARRSAVGRFSPTGDYSFYAAIPVSGYQVTDLCMGRDGRLYQSVNFESVRSWIWESLAGLSGTVLDSQSLPDVSSSTLSFDALTSDREGNFYVAYRGTLDQGFPGAPRVGSGCIRKIAADGSVSLVAGRVNSADQTSDGVGAAAGFGTVTGMALDAKGNLLVVDRDNHTIRQVAPDGTVTTIGGTAGAAGHADGIGANARFYYPEDIAIAANGDLFITSGTTIRRGIKIEAPLIERQPSGAAVSGGVAFTLSVSAVGEPPLTYQWLRNGAPIAGATAPTYVVNSASAADAGTYAVTVTNSFGSTTSDPASVTVSTPTPPPPSPASSSSGAGGGAATLWFFPTVVAAILARALRRRQRT